MLWLKKLKKLFQIGKKPSYLEDIIWETFAKSQKACEFAGYKRKNKQGGQRTMGFRGAKISFDGSHYIATPKENFPRGKSDDGLLTRHPNKRRNERTNLKLLTKRVRNCLKKSEKSM